jgi:hypothetical protein
MKGGDVSELHFFIMVADDLIADYKVTRSAQELACPGSHRTCCDCYMSHLVDTFPSRR